MDQFDGEEYQARFDALAAKGVDIHGEASLIRSFDPVSVLDAGCGTGRVAIELARHGIEVVGVDVDNSMIAEAKRRAPELSWNLQDLATLKLGRTFDIVALPGNVPIFCPEEDRPALIRSCAEHVAPGGRLIAGFQLKRGYALALFDQGCRDAGLTLESRFSTWQGTPFNEGDDYAVSLYRRL